MDRALADQRAAVSGVRRGQREQMDEAADKFSRAPKANGNEGHLRVVSMLGQQAEGLAETGPAKTDEVVKVLEGEGRARDGRGLWR